jgi:hypothetical protein
MAVLWILSSWVLWIAGHRVQVVAELPEGDRYELADRALGQQQESGEAVLVPGTGTGFSLRSASASWSVSASCDARSAATLSR